MFMKTAIVLALLVGTASAVLAAPKKTYSTNPDHDVYNMTGKYVGSDPDPFIRQMLQRDWGN